MSKARSDRPPRCETQLLGQAPFLAGYTTPRAASSTENDEPLVGDRAPTTNIDVATFLSNSGWHGLQTRITRSPPQAALSINDIVNMPLQWSKGTWHLLYCRGFRHVANSHRGWCARYPAAFRIPIELAKTTVGETAGQEREAPFIIAEETFI